MTTSVEGPIALYIHIPFCETKCPYCDFNTYAGIEPLVPAYVAALRKEIELWGEALGRPAVATVFFGGGTPSYLPSRHIVALMASVRAGFELDGDAEVTLEANPGDFTDDKLAAYLAGGINRLSIGVQSLDDGLLKVLGRRHNAAEAERAYRMAVAAGFDNVSIDLMYGLPYQSIDQWRETLESAESLGPQHISMYGLTLEGGTPLERQVKTGVVPVPDPDLAADMYLMAEDAMARLGYRHYEISNWALPGRESRHNLTYWENRPYLGVGPGAHSYLTGRRFWNLKSPKEYTRRLAPSLALPRDGADLIATMPAVGDVEVIDRRLEMAETMMMGLRLDTGVGVAGFASRFGATPSEVYSDVIAEMEDVGLLTAGDGAVALTPRGRLLGNEVFSRFVG
jgi:oxygen-independent coproporphyrinogen-3 oxidase